MQRVIEISDLRALIRRNEAGPFGVRNRAIITAAALWGLTASELSLVRVRDVVAPSGQLRLSWELSKEVAYNEIPRKLYTEHPALQRYLREYLDWRLAENVGVSKDTTFGGLDPDSSLFVSNRLESLTFSERETGKPQPSGANYLFREIFAAGGIEDLSYSSFRRSLILHLHRQGCTIKDIMVYTGYTSYESVRRIVDTDPKKVEDAVANAYGKF